LPCKFAKCVSNMIAYSWLNGLKIYQMGITERMGLEWARNDLARTALTATNEYTGEPFTHFLWMDNDHVFNPDLACVLALNSDKDMISALYYGRTKPLPVVYVKDNSDDEYKHFPLIQVPDDVFRCDAVGFGALLMKREVFERVPEPWFTLDYRGGEDIAFCVSARKHGVEIYCDGRYKLGHIGDPQIVTEQNYLSHLEANKDLYADKVKVNLGGQNG